MDNYHDNAVTFDSSLCGLDPGFIEYVMTSAFSALPTNISIEEVTELAGFSSKGYKLQLTWRLNNHSLVCKVLPEHVFLKVLISGDDEASQSRRIRRHKLECDTYAYFQRTPGLTSPIPMAKYYASTNFDIGDTLKQRFSQYHWILLKDVSIPPRNKLSPSISFDGEDIPKSDPTPTSSTDSSALIAADNTLDPVSTNGISELEPQPKARFTAMPPGGDVSVKNEVYSAEPSPALSDIATTTGAAIADLITGLSLKQTLAVVDSLTSLHAFCFKQDDWKEIFPAADRDTARLIVDISKECSQENAEMFPEIWNFNHDELTAKILNIDEICAGFDFEPSVIVHGDLWCNNLMFRSDIDGSTTDELVAILDWEFVNRGSCMADLVNFLFTNVTTETRRNHLSTILRYYLDQLQAKLELIGIGMPFTYESMLELYRSTIAYGCKIVPLHLNFQLKTTFKHCSENDRIRFAQRCADVISDGLEELECNKY